MISTAIVTTTTNHSLIKDQLHELCILHYKMKILTLYHSLWTTYWQSGFGQLIQQPSQLSNSMVIYPLNITIWPETIQKKIRSINKKLKKSQHITALDLVRYHRNQLEAQLRNTQIQWNQKANQLTGYHLQVEQLLQQYIDQHLNKLQLKIDYEIKLVTYDYHIEAIKQEFHHQNPTDSQVCSLE
jgi:hypothetical protein